MAKDMTLRAVVKFVGDEFTKGARTMLGQLQQLKGAIQTTFAIGSIAAFGRSLVVTTKNFEDAMARVQAVSDATSEQFQMMRNEAIKLGASTRYTATQVADTLEVLTRNGMSAENATKSLSGVLKLAQANAVGLADAGNMVTNTLNMFGLTVRDVSRVNDVLSSTVSNTATNLYDLYDALVNAAPMANALGFSIEETSAALGALAQRGIKGADAGTQLRMALQKLVDPSAIKKMQKYGIQLDEETVKLKGLQYVLETLSKADLSIAALNDIFTVRSSKAVLQLVNSLTDFNKILAITNDATGTTDRMFREGVGSMRYEIEVLRSVWESFLISVGEKTKGPFNSIVRALQTFIKNFQTGWGTFRNVMAGIIVFLEKSFVKYARTVITSSKQIQIQNDITTQKQLKNAAEKVLANKSAEASERAAAEATIAAANKEMAALRAKSVTYRAWASVLSGVVGVAIAGVTLALTAWISKLVQANAAEKEFTDKISSMNTNFETMKRLIGTGEDSDSVTAAVKMATKAFPEFADKINQAHEAAGKTGNYDILIEKLQEISELQIAVEKAEHAQGKRNKMLEELGKQLYKDSRPIAPNNKSYSDAAKTINLAMSNLGKSNNEIEKMMIRIVDIVAANSDNMDAAGEKIGAYLKKYGYDASKLDLKRFANNLYKYLDDNKLTLEGSGFAITKTNMRDLANATKDADEKTTEAQRLDINERFASAMEKFYASADEIATETKGNAAAFKKKMGDAVTELEKAVKPIYKNLSQIQLGRLKELRDKYPAPTGSGSGDGGSSSTSKKKTEQDKFNDTIEDYTKEVTKNKNLLENGVLTQKQYDAAMAKLTKETVEAVAAFSDLDEKIKKMPKQFQDAATDLKGNIQNLPQLRANEILTDYESKKETLETAKSQTTDPEKIKDIDGELDELAIKTHDAIIQIENFSKTLEDASDDVKKTFKTLSDKVKSIKEEKKQNQITKLNQDTKIKSTDEIAQDKGVKKIVLPAAVQPYFDENGFRKDVEGDFKKDPLSVEAKAELEADNSIDALSYKVNKLFDEDYELTVGIANTEIDINIKKEQISEVKKNIDDLNEKLEKLKNGEKVDIDLIPEQAKQRLEELKAELQKLMEELQSLEDKAAVAGLLKKLNDGMEGMKTNTLENISSMASAFDRLYDAVKNIADAFGVELEWKGLEKVMAVINGVVQAMEAMKTMIEVVTAIQKMSSKQVAKANVEQAVSNLLVAKTEQTKAGAAAGAAVAEGSESVAKIPYVGAILAVAAAASIAAALLAAMGKFENGGIIGGNSTHGDHQIVRANSGELILNKAQQGNLYRAIASGNLGGGSVEFKISGDNLIGVLKNNNRLWHK